VPGADGDQGQLGPTTGIVGARCLSRIGPRHPNITGGQSNRPLSRVGLYKSVRSAQVQPYLHRGTGI
jgi:hypothetical protein